MYRIVAQLSVAALDGCVLAEVVDILEGQEWPTEVEEEFWDRLGCTFTCP